LNALSNRAILAIACTACPLALSPLTATAQQFTVENRTFLLSERAGACVVAPVGDPAEAVVLDLDPPCAVPTWSVPPPASAGSPSDGVSVGSVGAAIAWRYPGAGNSIVVVVIGDDVPGHILASEAGPVPPGCGGSVQALLLKGGELRAGTKRGQVGLVCPGGGLDERTFWMLAYPSPP
jgi:hypothetical protein